MVAARSRFSSTADRAILLVRPFSRRMENPCYKCGQIVGEGTPFCRHCSAPQIRVVIAEPVPPLSLATASTSPDSAALPLSQAIPVVALPMQWSQALRPCALAALVAVLLIFLRLYPFVAMISAGFLAVVFYRQRRPGTMIKAATGARMGALSGLLWFAMLSMLGALVVIFLHKGPELRNGIMTTFQEAASQTADPNTLALLERAKTPDGFEALVLASLVLAFLAAIALGALGGALGAAILGRRDKS